MGFNRWAVRATVFASSMTDESPPFRLDGGGTEPEASAESSDASVPVCSTVRVSMRHMVAAGGPEPRQPATAGHAIAAGVPTMSDPKPPG